MATTTKKRSSPTFVSMGRGEHMLIRFQDLQKTMGRDLRQEFQEFLEESYADGVRPPLGAFIAQLAFEGMQARRSARKSKR